MKSEQTKQLSKKLCSSRLVSKRAREANERFRREGEENWSVLLFALGPFTSLHRSRRGKVHFVIGAYVVGKVQRIQRIYKHERHGVPLSGYTL